MKSKIKIQPSAAVPMVQPIPKPVTPPVPVQPFMTKAELRKMARAARKQSQGARVSPRMPKLGR
jgi:hypothetical protein